MNHKPFRWLILLLSVAMPCAAATVARYGDQTNRPLATSRSISQSTALPLTSGENSWSSGAAIPSASYGLGAAVAGGKLYAISGFATTRVAGYDPATNGWFTAASLPQLLQYFGVATLNGQIYVVGGDTGGGGDRATLYCYNPSANAWSTLVPMALGPRYGLGAAELGGKIYAVGGRDSSGMYLARVEAYDPASTTWSTRASMPQAHYAALVGAINGKLYVAGGSDASGAITTTHIYDPSTDSWTTGAPAPFAGGGNGVALGAKLYSIGGVGNSQQQVYAYDPMSDSWNTNLALLPVGRHDLGAAADAATGRIFAVGGWNDGYISDLNIFTSPGNAAQSGSNASLNLKMYGMYAGLTIAGKVGGVYEIDYSTNLNSTNWIALTTITLNASPYLFIDTASAGAPARFYRALLLP